MSRRPVNLNRWSPDGGNIPFVGSIQSKSGNSPLLSIGFIVVVHLSAILFLLICTQRTLVPLGLIWNISKSLFNVVFSYQATPTFVSAVPLYPKTLFGYFNLLDAVYLSGLTFNYIVYLMNWLLIIPGCNPSYWLLL